MGANPAGMRPAWPRAVPGRALPYALLVSALAHVVLAGAALAYARWTAQAASRPSHQVLVTKLVRLGEPRPKELLPHRAPPQPRERDASPAPVAPATALPASAAAPSAPAAAEAAPARAAALARMGRSLDRLRRHVDGQADGDAQGETDLAQEGQKWYTEVAACIRKYFTIEGIDPRRALGRHALVGMHVGSDGKIVDHTIRTSSGLSAFDQAVGRAVSRCGQVTPPPEGLRTAVRRDGIEINFSP